MGWMSHKGHKYQLDGAHNTTDFKSKPKDTNYIIILMVIYFQIKSSQLYDHNCRLIGNLDKAL